MEITDPTLVFFLITIGLVGIGAETLTPGGIFPGLIGLISLALGVVGAVQIGVSAVGAGLLLLSIALFIAAAAFNAYRPLSIASVIALIASGIFLFPRDQDPTSIIAVVIGGAALGALLLFVIERAATVKASPVRYGPEELVGVSGEVRASLDPSGQVFVDGTLWQAELAEGSGPVRLGQQITVEEVRGLTLVVRTAEEPPPERDMSNNQAHEGVDR
ncbi:MAG: hypothetical protein JJE10_04570 [Thermoleophilia bacterium]|nr:hypothetical protein [Thermoleophilia bacterium]